MPDLLRRRDEADQFRRRTIDFARYVKNCRRHGGFVTSDYNLVCVIDRCDIRFIFDAYSDYYLASRKVSATLASSSQ